MKPPRISISNHDKMTLQQAIDAEPAVLEMFMIPKPATSAERYRNHLIHTAVTEETTYFIAAMGSAGKSLSVFSEVRDAIMRRAHRRLDALTTDARFH